MVPNAPWSTLSRAAGLQPCYACAEGADGLLACRASPTVASPYLCTGFRLPTEAEWEFAARAGATAAFPNGGNLVAGTEDSIEWPVHLDNGQPLASIAWYRWSSEARPHLVGALEPNRWGLFDVSGNVFEWCHDVYVEAAGAGAPAVDPVGTGSGDTHSVRGGSLTNAPRIQRLALRAGGGGRHLDLGLRVVRTAP